jgi:signal peptidase I
MSVRSPRGSGGSGTPGGQVPATGPGKSSGAGKGAGAKGSKSTSNSLIELVGIVVVAVLLALGIQAFLVKPYKIPSGSMEPTLAIGQRVLVNRIGMSLNGPHVGEIVVFHPPVGADPQEETHEAVKCGRYSRPADYGGAACDETNPAGKARVNFIKRIVAGPGDEIYIKEGHVYREAAGKSAFVREQDSYIKACGGAAACNFPTPIKIPAGHWFMMGDNRGESDDSRFWGPIPTGWIIGGAFATYWPPDRIGLL